MIRSKLTQVAFGRFWRNKSGALVLLLLVLLFGAGTVSSSPLVIPTISVTSVQADDTVTIQTHNFPAGLEFVVRMGEMYTAGIGGEYVATTPSGTGGSFAVTYKIPDSLKGRGRIAIRLDSTWGGYYSYNWFYNNTANVGVPVTAPVVNGSGAYYPGIPTFKITAVETGKSVTIETNNFPAGYTFAVTMGKMYTRGIGGIFIQDINSENGGRLTFTFPIPDALKNDDRIAIRAQTGHANPFYAFNWFYNNDAPAPTPTPPTPQPPSPGTVYYGIPTFTVCSVTKDGNATILTKNFPTNQTFAVTMGPMYTQGIGGYLVSPSLESKDTPSARYTFSIPAEMRGAARISIRAQTAHAYPFYAYNWFYNATTTVDFCQ